MATVASIRIEGLDALKRKLTPALIAQPARNLFERGTTIAQGEVRKRTPVDRGPLRNSMTREVDSSAVPRWGKVGTNLVYGPAQEFGFDPGQVFPPPQVMELWGRRHGFPPGSGFLISRSIFRKGVQGHHMLRDGLEASEGRVRALVSVMAKEIEQEAAKGVR